MPGSLQCRFGKSDFLFLVFLLLVSLFFLAELLIRGVILCLCNLCSFLLRTLRIPDHPLIAGCFVNLACGQIAVVRRKLSFQKNRSVLILRFGSIVGKIPCVGITHLLQTVIIGSCSKPGRIQISHTAILLQLH